MLDMLAQAGNLQLTQISVGKLSGRGAWPRPLLV